VTNDVFAAKGNKQLAKIIKTEAKVEKKALNLALKELAELQKIQKTAVKVVSFRPSNFPIC
jgi:hypothetical protein